MSLDILRLDGGRGSHCWRCFDVVRGYDGVKANMMRYIPTERNFRGCHVELYLASFSLGDFGSRTLKGLSEC